MSKAFDYKEWLPSNKGIEAPITPIPAISTVAQGNAPIILPTSAMSKKTKKAGLTIMTIHRKMWEGLSNESCGELLKALIAYQFDGVTPDLPPYLEAVFNVLRPVIDEQRAKYQERCEKNSKSIQDYWDMKKG